MLRKWGFIGEPSLVIISLPPIIGGVSTHGERLKQLLRKTDEKALFFSPNNNKIPFTNFFRILFLMYSSEVRNVHLHTNSTQILTAVILGKLLFSIRIIAHIHNPYPLQNKSLLFRGLFRLMIHFASHICCVSNESAKNLRSILKRSTLDINIQSAFIPPQIEDTDNILKLYPQKIHDFINVHDPLLIMTVYKISFKDSTDVYGIDMATELILKLANEFNKVGLLIMIGKINDSKYLDSQLNKLKEKGLSEKVAILSTDLPAWPLFTKADLLVRPTLYDGSSISILEALHVDLDVLCSDATERPDDCILFKNRDIDDLYLKAQEYLSKIQNSKINGTSL